MKALLLQMGRCSRIMMIRKYAAKPGYQEAHMNELPSPCGPWEPWYAKKQAAYTRILFLGIVCFAGSLGLAIFTESIFLNWSPPAKPAPPTVVDDEDDTALPNLGLPPC